MRVTPDVALPKRCGTAAGDVGGHTRTDAGRAGEVPAVAGVLRPDRRYERMDITGLTGVTHAQRQGTLAPGAVEPARGR